MWMCLLGLGCAALAVGAGAGNNNPPPNETNGNEVSRFDAISQRNIFDLTPIPIDTHTNVDHRPRRRRM